MKKKVLAAVLAALMIFSLSGCGGSDKPESDKGGKVKAIAESDYPLKDYMVPDSGAMYKITAEALGLNQFDVSSVKALGGNLAVVYNGAIVSVIDPLNLEIKKTLDMSADIMSFDSVFATENEIAFVCTELEKVIFCDSDLEIIEEVPVALGRITPEVSSDLKKIFLDNEQSTELYVYDRDSKTTETVCTELAQKLPVRGFSGFDGFRNQVYYGIWDDEHDFIETQVWNLSDSTVAATIPEQVDALSFGEKYMVGCDMKYRNSQCLIKNMETSTSYILAVDTIMDSANTAFDINGEIVCSSEIYATADLTNRESFKLYDFEGNKIAETEIVTEKTAENLSSVCIDKKMNCCALVSYGEENGLYIWDLSAEESKAESSVNCLYEQSLVDSETIDERVRNRVSEFEEKYGIKVCIGDEAKANPNIESENKLLYDDIALLQAINSIDRALLRYPQGLTQQINDRFTNGMRLLLVGSISSTHEEYSNTLENSGGITDILDGYVTVTLDVTSGDYVYSAFYHEFCHVLHKCVNHNGTKDYDQGIPDAINIDVWESHNPKDFSYGEEYSDYDTGKIDDSYVCGNTSDPNGWYFARTYGKVSLSEDVATVMEEAMNNQLLAQGYFESPVLQTKMKYISECIRSEFDTTDWPEKTAWEYVLK